MISKNAIYWIWLTLTIGYDTPKAKRLAELYPDISQFYLRGEREWRFCGIFHTSEIEKLKSKNLEDAQKIIDRCRQLNYSVICIDDDQYPTCLYQIYAPPALLYVSGRLPDVDNQLTIGIVGTRTASRYGTENSYKIAYSLAKYNVPIISGGALGVDGASHRGALAANGVTVCVRGCGINYNYLMQNADMRHAIESKGAVISEYPPDEPPRRYYFPARNRIIAALSDGVVIIESGAKSGSLITANLALEMGKEVFALLGNNTPQNEGSNKRIKEGSAIPITDFMDILTSFENLVVTSENYDPDDISLADIAAIPVKGKRGQTVIKPPATQNNHSFDRHKNRNNIYTVSKDIKVSTEEKPTHKKVELHGDAAEIYHYLTAQPVHIDKIAGDLGIPVSNALSALTYLELQNLVQSLQGRNFVLK